MKNLQPDKEYRILIVDDVPKNIQILGNILKNNNFQISYALNGKEALEMVQEQLYDLILLDIMMPLMNGFEVCERIKANKKTAGIPIIFLTAKADKESVVKGFLLGAEDYVTKPFSAEELLARVSTHLALKYQREQLETINKTSPIAAANYISDNPKPSQSGTGTTPAPAPSPTPAPTPTMSNPDKPTYMMAPDYVTKNPDDPDVLANVRKNLTDMFSGNYGYTPPDRPMPPATTPTTATAPGSKQSMSVSNKNAASSSESEEKHVSANIDSGSKQVSAQADVKDIVQNDPYVRDEIKTTYESLRRNAAFEDIANTFAEGMTGVQLGNQYKDMAADRLAFLADYNNKMTARGITEKLTAGTKSFDAKGPSASLTTGKSSSTSISNDVESKFSSSHSNGNGGGTPNDDFEEAEFQNNSKTRRGSFLLSKDGLRARFTDAVRFDANATKFNSTETALNKASNYAASNRWGIDYVNNTDPSDGVTFTGPNWSMNVEKVGAIYWIHANGDIPRNFLETTGFGMNIGKVSKAKYEDTSPGATHQ